MTLASCWRVGWTTTANILLYAATRGRYLWLEGRVRDGVFENWMKAFRYQPTRFVRPDTEAEIVDLVKSAKSLRLFGSGHSFNNGVVSEDTLVSLDCYSGLVESDLGQDQITVRAGTRVRDCVRLLAEEGLAFQALPSHDAQSIGGILSTDVHGTGRDWGFVSESVVRLRLIDGTGAVHDCQPSDDLFKAAVGGAGAVGVITEVTLQGVPRFNVDQGVRTVDLSYVRQHLDELLAANDHLSLYLYPFSDTCQVNTWNRTDDEQSSNGNLREFLKISLDALLAAWVGNALAYGRLLPLSRFWSRVSFLNTRSSNLVLESNKAYNRSIYHLHQELEFTVPFEDTFEECDRFLKLYEKLYRTGLPYTLIEVRFTPDGHERTLIGAGRGRRSTWIDLICNDSDGYENYYAAAVGLVKEIGARPHLGKFCSGLDFEDLARVHGDRFDTFLRLVGEHDPQGKFTNDFTRRLFGSASRPLSHQAQ